MYITQNVLQVDLLFLLFMQIHWWVYCAIFWFSVWVSISLYWLWNPRVNGVVNIVYTYMYWSWSSRVDGMSKIIVSRFVIKFKADVKAIFCLWNSNKHYRLLHLVHASVIFFCIHAIMTIKLQSIYVLYHHETLFQERNIWGIHVGELWAVCLIEIAIISR